MSLLPIIYTSVLIFAATVTTVMLISYIIYKAKGGGPKPAAVQTEKPVSYSKQINRPVNKIYTTHSHGSQNQRNYRTKPNQSEPMFYKKPVSIHPNHQPVRRKTLTPRIQVLNKPVEKKIVVVRKSANYNSYDANNFLGYYNENERGVLIQA